MRFRVVHPPNNTPLTIDEVKLFLSIDDNLSDMLLESFIKAATLRAETYLQKQLMTQTIEFAFDYFPNQMLIPVTTVQSITSIVYQNDQSLFVILPPSHYILDQFSPKVWILPTVGNNWPSTLNAANAVIVEAVVGYGNDSSDVPDDIRLALMVLINYWVIKQQTIARGDEYTPSRIPFAFEELLFPYRLPV